MNNLIQVQKYVRHYFFSWERVMMPFVKVYSKKVKYNMACPSLALDFAFPREWAAKWIAFSEEVPAML